MSRVFGLLVLGAVSSVLAFAVDNPTCSVQNAAVAGQRVVLQCEEPQLLVSQDQGTSWQPIPFTYDKTIRSFKFLDANRGFMAGDDGLLLASEDGGRTWAQVSVPTKEHLTGISFVGNEGWVSGYGGVILHSSDGGKAWSAQTTGVTQTLENVYFADASHGWAVGWIGTIIRTADGGASWKEVQNITGAEVTWSLNAVYFRDLQNGWAVGFNGQMLRSKDGGANWTALKSPVTATLTSILFDKDGTGYIAAGSDLLVSKDAGETWSSTEIEDPIFLSHVLNVNGSIWAIGEFGIMAQKDQKWQRLSLDQFDQTAS
jgi:photosystem II stability/assembly factor-like uncharacterized protein